MANVRLGVRPTLKIPAHGGAAPRVASRGPRLTMTIAILAGVCRLSIPPIAARAAARDWDRAAAPPFPPTPWSAESLRLACARKRIRCEETSAYRRIRGFVVTVGRTSIISVSASLREPEKILTIAHELAHIALGHVYPASQASDPSPRSSAGMPPGAARLAGGQAQHEGQARLWAAHLLVDPAVFSWHERDARARGRSAARAIRLAKERTAACLNIPIQAVDLWWRSRDHIFDVPPRAWLAR